MATPVDKTKNKRDRPADHTPPTGFKKNKAEECVTCKKEANVDAIECQWCTGWEHKVCAIISSEEYVLLDTISTNVMFFCSICAKKVPAALASFGIDAKIESIENKVTRLCNDVNKQLELQSKKIEGKLSTLESKIHTPAAPSAPVTDESNKLLSTLINEEKEKSKRKLNLIFHNIAESTKEDGVARKQDDISCVSNILQQYLGLSTKIEKTFRLGQRKEKPRLLKVSVSSEQEKAMILRNCIKLHNSDNPAIINKIFIIPDLTPIEQAANKKLRDELKEKNRDGNFFVSGMGE